MAYNVDQLVWSHYLSQISSSTLYHLRQNFLLENCLDYYLKITENSPKILTMAKSCTQAVITGGPQSEVLHVQIPGQCGHQLHIITLFLNHRSPLLATVAQEWLKLKKVVLHYPQIADLKKKMVHGIKYREEAARTKCSSLQSLEQLIGFEGFC